MSYTYFPFFLELLKGSKFQRDISEMKRYFDRTTKCAFRDESDPHYIRFGSARDRDPKLKITAGKLRLEGSVCTVFAPDNNLFSTGRRLPLSLSPQSSVSSMASYPNDELPINLYLYAPTSINLAYYVPPYLF